MPATTRGCTTCVEATAEAGIDLRNSIRVAKKPLRGERVDW